jgi:hypothetical protein
VIYPYSQWLILYRYHGGTLLSAPSTHMEIMRIGDCVFEVVVYKDGRRSNLENGANKMVKNGFA